MNNYIQKLINYFFHHKVSDELTARMYERMSFPREDKEREEVLSHIWDELEGVDCPEEEVDAAFRRLEHTLERKSIGGQLRERKKVSWGRIAALWVLPFIMLCGSAYFYHNTIDAGKKAVAEISYQQCYAAVGTRERVVLPDSSVVWLNAGSLLVYPSTFLTETRNVYLSGEGFFEVAKDKRHPFIVTTNHLQLEVLGTAFNVSDYPESDQVKTTLETGSLQVEVGRKAMRFLLVPDEQLVFIPSTGLVERYKVKAADYSDWRLGGLFFSDVPFNDVLSTLERTYGVKFHLKTSIYQNQKLRVHFNKGESLENVMKIIKILIPGIEYRIEEEEIYLE